MRFLHRVYALLFGYFWITCPSCGRWFGGHENGGGTLWMSCDGMFRSGRVLCPKCPQDIYDKSYPADGIRTINVP